jgi:hypothetical protein
LIESGVDPGPAAESLVDLVLDLVPRLGVLVGRVARRSTSVEPVEDL